MEPFLNWLRENPDIFGFGVATLIFLITIILVSRKMIGFFITLLFLLFALLTGFVIINQDIFREYLETKVEERKFDSDGSLSTFKRNLIEKYDNLRTDVDKLMEE